MGLSGTILAFFPCECALHSTFDHTTHPDEAIIPNHTQKIAHDDSAKKGRHTFSTLPEFDKAMKKIVAVPKEDVEKREKESRTPRVQ